MMLARLNLARFRLWLVRMGLALCPERRRQ